METGEDVRGSGARITLSHDPATVVLPSKGLDVHGWGVASVPSISHWKEKRGCSTVLQDPTFPGPRFLSSLVPSHTAPMHALCRITAPMSTPTSCARVHARVPSIPEPISDLTIAASTRYDSATWLVLTTASGQLYALGDLSLTDGLVDEPLQQLRRLPTTPAPLATVLGEQRLLHVATTTGAQYRYWLGSYQPSIRTEVLPASSATTVSCVGAPAPTIQHIVTHGSSVALLETGAVLVGGPALSGLPGPARFVAHGLYRDHPYTAIVLEDGRIFHTGRLYEVFHEVPDTEHMYVEVVPGPVPVQLR